MSRYYRNRIGFVLLAVFLILYGLQVLGVKFTAMDTIMGLCALAAGILIFLNR